MTKDRKTRLSITKVALNSLSQLQDISVRTGYTLDVLYDMYKAEIETIYSEVENVSRKRGT